MAGAGVSDDLYVERIMEPAGIDRAAWDGVVAKSGSSVFSSYAFIDAYHRFPLLAIDACVYLVVRSRSGGEAVAVVPAYLQTQHDPIGSLAPVYPEASSPALLTPSWHCYDGEIASVGDPEQVVPVLVDALRDAAQDMGAGWFGMLNVTPEGPVGTAIRHAGLPLRHIVERYRMDLTGLRTLEEYIAGLGSNSRHTLRRNFRRADEAGVRTEILAPADASLDEIAELAGRTAARFDNPSFYRPEMFGDFVRALGGAAGVIEVRERGRLVSSAVYLLDEQRLHAWAGGVDYEVSGPYSPYRIMHAALVTCAIESGRRMLEGGRSNGAFKSQHGMRPLPLSAMVLPT